MVIPWLYIALLVLLMLLLPTAYAAKIGAPFVPARRRGLQKAFDTIGLNAEDVFVELGAGDGRIVMEAAKRGAKARGYELSPFLWVIAKLRTFKHKDIQILFKNFYTVSFNDATVLYAFLMPQNMERLRQYLQTQHIPHGRYLLLYGFALPQTQPETVIQEPNELPVYVYPLSALTHA